MSDELISRIADFIRRDTASSGEGGEGTTDDGRFDELASAAFRWQVERIEPYRRLCETRGVQPGSVTRWRDVPMIPALAFKSAELAAAEPQETFRSSGTTGVADRDDEGEGEGEGEGELQRSVHRHPFPDLYRLTIDRSFPSYCLAGIGAGAPMLALLPNRDQAPDSSLSFMVDHAIRSFGGPESAWAFGRRGVEPRETRPWCGARQRAGRPCLVLATAFSLVQWLESLERLGLRFRLPPGSAIFVTGGFKGKSRELAAEEIAAAALDRLAIPAERIVGEYGMTELTSQLYTRALLGGDREVYVAPPWMRVRILDPETLAEAAPGTPGLVAIFDLANIGSAVHLLTEDLGIAAPGGIRLVGRAAGAELRGCSLLAEELAAGGAGAPA